MKDNCSFYGRVITKTIQKAALCFPSPKERCPGLENCKKETAERVRRCNTPTPK